MTDMYMCDQLNMEVKLSEYVERPQGRKGSGRPRAVTTVASITTKPSDSYPTPVLLARQVAFARRLLAGELGQQLELIAHVMTCMNPSYVTYDTLGRCWVLGFLKVRDSKLETEDANPLVGLKADSRRLLTLTAVIAGDSMKTPYRGSTRL